MAEKSPSDLREDAWKYFALHAEQRMKVFNFYVVLSTLVVGGLITVIKDGTNLLLGAPIGFLLAFLSFVFWKLDSRVKHLIKHAEAAMKKLEGDSAVSTDANMPSRLCLFSHEEHSTNRLRKGQRWWDLSKHYTYSECFNMVFLVFGLSGAVTATILLFVARR